jgi:two-component system response regulator
MTSILVVDDSENDRFLVHRALGMSTRSFFVAEAEDVSTAIKYVFGNDRFSDRTRYPIPDLVICDIRLTHNGGFALIDSIHSRPELRELKVAVMSGLISNEDRALAFEKGACACIDKKNLVSDQAAFLNSVEACLRDAPALR